MPATVSIPVTHHLLPSRPHLSVMSLLPGGGCRVGADSPAASITQQGLPNQDTCVQVAPPREITATNRLRDDGRGLLSGKRDRVAQIITETSGRN